MDATLARIRACARHSIGRGFLFALLAIAVTMSGLIIWPVAAFRTGALLSMFALTVLALRAVRAPHRPYRRTETWVLLDRRHDLPEERAQAIITGVLVETYWEFAEFSAWIALGLWLCTFILALWRG